MSQSKNMRGTLRPNFAVIERLAAQMGDCGRWCVWRAFEREGGKLGKVPQQFKAGKLSAIGCNDHTQWADFATARQWFDKAGGGVSGLGILIGSNSKDNPETRYSSGLVALDLDNVLGETGELSAAVPSEVRLAVKALQDAGVYIEVSPSGAGLRALWLGSKGLGIREKVSIEGISREIYDGSTAGRYVTLTGQVWGGSAVGLVEQPEAFALDIADWLGLLNEQNSASTTVEGRPRDLPPISDDELIKKLKQSGQGKGKKLFDGDMSEYSGDHSKADAALCRLVARWTDDPAQVGRVWGASALSKRDKFNKRKDYRERTINVVLASARKAAAEGSSAAAGKAERVKAALAGGDAGGALASALASWGGKVPATLAGVESVLSLDKRLDGAYAYDEFCQQTLKLQSLWACLGDVVPRDKEPDMGQPWADSDDSAITIWLERVWGVSIKHPTTVYGAVEVAARRRAINTVGDALSGLVWDGKKRLDSWLVNYLSADDSHDTSRYLSSIGRAWIIGTVARAFEPGCKHDHTLTLEAGQGFGKSMAIRTLAEAVSPNTYREGLPPLGLGSEPERALQGVWICELAELAFMDRATAEHTKSFMSRQEDSVRNPHGKRYGRVKRTVSFAASTNQGQFVKDSSGARRFWVFRVRKPIDIEALRAVAPQLWAEAVAAYKAGESWWLTDPTALRDADAAQWARVERQGWDELIEENIIDALLMPADAAGVCDWSMQALDVWRLITKSDDASAFNKDCKALAAALERCGFERWGRGGRSMWKVGPRLLGRLNQARL